MNIIRNTLQYAAVAAILFPSVVFVLAGFGSETALHMIVQYLCFANGGCK